METKRNQKTNRKGKRKMVGWIVAGIFVVVAFGVGAMFCAPWSPLNKEHKEAANLPIADVDFSKLKDGTYVGEYAGGMYKWRVNKVQVTVDSGKVKQIELLESPNKNEKTVAMVNPLYERVIEAQSLQVDVISGATLDSRAFLKGVEEALVNGQKR